MEAEGDFAETDLHILTFDVPDDALERAAGAPSSTLVNCTNPMLLQCPMTATAGC
jgi:hypothetical protein